MVMEHRYVKVSTSILETLRMISKKVMEQLFMIMASHMKELGKTENLMGKELIKVQLSPIKVDGEPIEWTVLESAFGKMVDPMREIMSEGKSKDMEFTLFQMENNIKETGYLGINMAMAR